MSTQMTHDEAVKICETLTPQAGNPPEVGWWMVSYGKCTPKMRWWNGSKWSVYCSQSNAEMRILNSEARKESELPLSEFAYYPRVWEGKFLARKKG